MKKILSFIVVLNFFCFTACNSYQPSKNEDRPELSELEIETTQSMTESQEFNAILPVTETTANVTSGGSYIYRGEPVKISYEYFIDGGVKNFGLMVLCNGIAVPFTTSQNEEASTLQIIENHVGETVSIDLFVTPVGSEGDQVSVQIVDIVEPDFNINSIDLNSDEVVTVLQPLISGHRYDVDSVGGINISLEAEGISSAVAISDQYETEEIPQNVIDANMQINDDGTVTNQLSYFKAEADTAKLYQLKKGETLPLDITFSGTEGQDIFVSFYLNNEIYPAFDGCEYVRCHVDDENYTKVHGELDTGKLETGRYICYTVCGNVEYNMHTDPIPAFILEVS